MAIVGDDKLPVPFGTDPQSVRQRVETMERLLERLFVIPGTKQAVGLDVILDVVPIVGDIAAAALGGYIVWEAENLGMSKWQMTRMTGNVGVNWLLGLFSVVPVVGVVPDSSISLKLAQPQDHQAPPRQASRRHGDDRGTSHQPFSNVAASIPGPFEFHFVRDRSPVRIGRRTIDEALLDQPAGERVELGNAAGAGDHAVRDPAVHAHREPHSDCAADPGLRQATRIVSWRDVAGDLFDVRSASA